MQKNCRICAAHFAPVPFAVLEMMFGTKERFDYTTCPKCGSIQIVEIPSNLGRYYSGNDYYSYRTVYVSGLKERIRRIRDAAYFGAGGGIGRFLASRQPALLMRVLADAGLCHDQRILDVGCGAGLLLDRLARIGFKQLSGVDPFVPAEIRTPSGVLVLKAEFREINAPQDVVIFNHSLEHVIDPAVELVHAASLLKGRGRCIVRIPTPTSMAWETYGADWVQLDAPRHIALPSRQGMASLAERTGFTLERVIDDSWAFGLWGSELYRDRVSLHGSDGIAVDPVAHFGVAHISECAAMATSNNAAGKGDQVAFVLRAVN